MDLSRRSFLSALGAGAVAGVASTVSGCAAGGAAGGGSGAAEGEITLLTPIYEGASGKALLERTLLPAFRKQYPKITVHVDYTTYAALNEKITTGLAGGLLADVVMVGVGWVPPFAHKHVFAPLPDEFATEHDYDPHVLEPSRYDGKLYALPVVLDTRFVAYRKDFFAEAGITTPPSNWAQLHETAKALTRPGRRGLDLFSIDLRQCWETFLFANGRTMFGPDGRTVTFADEAGVESLQFFLDALKDGTADYGLKTTAGQPSTLQRGSAAMAVVNNSLWIQLRQQSPDLVKQDKFGTFVLRNTTPAILQGGTLVAQSARSRAPGAAAALVRFLASPQATLRAAQQRGAVVADRSLRDSDYVKGNPFVRFALDNLDKARSEGGTPAWMEIREKVKPALESAVVGQKSAKDALTDLAGICSDAIARL